jgi:hypothetical protein
LAGLSTSSIGTGLLDVLFTVVLLGAGAAMASRFSVARRIKAAKNMTPATARNRRLFIIKPSLMGVDASTAVRYIHPP